LLSAHDKGQSSDRLAFYCSRSDTLSRTRGVDGLVTFTCRDDDGFIGSTSMAGRKSDESNQQRLADKNREARTTKQVPSGNEIAEKANMKRQQKGMHKQSGKR
jgi:hypothetical protein